MKKFIFLLIILAPSFAVISQKKLNEPNIYFEHVYLPGSLHFNPTIDISQDSTGLLWFATNNGIYRYDGYEIISSNSFEAFKPVREKPISSVLSGPDNTVYASLKSGGLIKFQNNFSGYTSYSGALRGYEVNDLFMLDGEVGFLSEGSGLFIMDMEGNKVVPLTTDVPVYSIHQKNNVIAAGGEGKILIYNGKKLYKSIELPEVKGYIKSIQLKDSIIHFNTSEDIYRLNLKTKHLDHLINHTSLNNTTINMVFNSTDNKLWILTNINGIYVVNTDNSLLHLEKNYFQKGSLSNSRTYKIFEDKYGLLWIGTGAGINKYDKSNRYFSHLSHNPANENSLSGDIIRGVYETSDEQVLIGTDDGVINIIDSARQKIKKISLNQEDDEHTVVPFTFLEKTSGKEVFIGASSGLYLMNLETSNLEFIMAPEGSNKRVREIKYYDENHIIGLSYGHIWKMDINTREVVGYDSFPGDIQSLLSGKARKLSPDHSGNIFIGGDGEIGLFNPEKKLLKTRTVASISDEGDTIKHMVLTLERYKNKLYIGTHRGGLFVLDLAEDNLQGKMLYFTKEHGLPDNTIYAVLRDNDGYFWLSTNNGVSRYNPETESFFNYDRNNGLQGEEFNRLAYAKTRRGEIILGGIEGLNIFFPEKAHHNTIRKVNPVLTGVQIINQFNEAGKIQHPRLDLLNTRDLTFDYNQNYLTFHFSSDNFSQPEKSKFYYKLENYDQNWIYSPSPKATYTGLDPGNYIFKVKAVDPYGNSSVEAASIPFVITSRWWRIWWIAILSSTIFLGFIVHSYRKNVKKNRAIKYFLENEIKRRTQELQNSKEELARLNAKKDFIFSILSHDLRSPLTTLKGFLGLLVDHFDTLDEKDIKLHAVNIKNSVAKSLDLLDNTLYWSLSQMGEIIYSPGEISLSLLFDKLHGLYDLTAKKKNIQLHFHLEENIMLFADENMTYITLRNLVSNAIKFTSSGHNVYISAEKGENEAAVIIRDEGRGIRAEDLSKLFDQNQHYMEKGTSNEKGTGLGLSLCKKFTDLNNGRIYVKSQEMVGSTFTVVLPIAPEKDQHHETISFARSDSNPGQ